MITVSPERLLKVGKVIRPHGLDGRLRVFSYAESEETFLNAGRVLISFGEGETCEHVIISIKPHQNVFLFKLEGLDSLEEAEPYRDADIFIRKDTLKKNEEGEYFWYDLIECEVYLKSGDYIGKIRDIFSTAAHDIYVATDGRREVMIPATQDAVEEINLEEKRVVIREMEGLLDLNEI